LVNNRHRRTWEAQRLMRYRMNPERPASKLNLRTLYSEFYLPVTSRDPTKANRRTPEDGYQPNKKTRRRVEFPPMKIDSALQPRLSVVRNWSPLLARAPTLAIGNLDVDLMLAYHLAIQSPIIADTTAGTTNGGATTKRKATNAIRSVHVQC